MRRQYYSYTSYTLIRMKVEFTLCLMDLLPVLCNTGYQRECRMRAEFMLIEKLHWKFCPLSHTFVTPITFWRGFQTLTTKYKDQFRIVVRWKGRRPLVWWKMFVKWAKWIFLRHVNYKFVLHRESAKFCNLPRWVNMPFFNEICCYYLSSVLFDLFT